MRNRPRSIGQFFGTACALTGLFAAGSALAEPARATSTITITVTGLRSSEGVVRACITTNPKQFPKCDSKTDSVNVVVPAATTVTLNFPNISPGRYAIALLHDENNNGKADRALLMMPTEGFGFSRDAKVRMGPPKFSAAAFDVTGGPMTQTIRMRYLF